MAKKYIAFISYRHAELDSAIAKKLHTLIEQYRIPRGLQNDGEKRLGVVFRDQEELHAASDLSSEIQNALNDTEFLIVICSKNSVESPWVTREIDHFLQGHDRSHVLTVLASGEPSEVFPYQLTQSPDGPDAPPVEPLAVDVRADTIAASCKKLRRELPRLISAILKCPYDALVMREQKRKMRRITGIAAGIMAILIGFTSMVLVKNRQIEAVNNQLETKNIELDRANTDLNQANNVLAEQKADIQLRESQLLAQDAEADLENADYIGAMKKALAALPHGKDDTRPYHAPAEYALMAAANVFQPGTPDEELNTVELEQLTNVADFVITDDGSRVISVDKFGTVCCFDASSGTQIWSQHAVPDDEGNANDNLHLFLCCDDTLVIRSTARQLAAYDLQTGRSLWLQTVGDIPDGYMFYQPQREALIFASAYSTGSFSYAYHLAEISVETGELLQDIPLYANDGSALAEFGETPKEVLSKAGIFSSDGTQFYGIYFDNDDYLHCFHADLSQGTSQILYAHNQAFNRSPFVIGISKDDEAISVIVQDPNDGITASAFKFRLRNGKLLWQTDIPEREYSLLYLVRPGNALFTPSEILIGASNQIIRLDAETGVSLQTFDLQTRIIAMTPVSDSTIGIALDDGTCLLSWYNIHNSLVLSTDPFLQVSAELGPCEIAKMWGGGIVQMTSENDSFVLGVGNFIRPGYVALIPTGKENTIQVIRPKQAPALVSYTAVGLPEKDFSSTTDCSVRQLGSQLIAGPFYQRSGSYSDQSYFVLEAATNQITATLRPQGTSYSDALYWLPDTLELLVCDTYSGVYLLSEDGEKEYLYDFEAEQEKLEQEEEWWTSTTSFGCASAYTHDGKALITAAHNSKTMEVWTNGVLTHQTQIPEALQFPVKDRLGKSALLQIGANGWIVTGVYEYSDPFSLTNIAVYSTAMDRWTTLRSDAICYNEDSIVTAPEKDWLACMGQDGTLQLFDLHSGNIITQFPTQIPFGSVLKMQFLLDDTHLAIKTSGGYLRIYNLFSGEQVYYDQFQDAFDHLLDVFEDSANQRLYLRGGPRSGICVDSRSWTALGYPESLLYYNSNTNLVYMTTSSWEESSLTYAQIPSTMELVQLGEDWLSDIND